MRDDGVLYICALDNIAENGDMPKQVLRIINKHWFEMRSPGFRRSYQAMGVNQRIDMLVRIQQDMKVEGGMYAVLGNGDQYRIDLVYHGQDSNQRSKIVDSKYYRQPTVMDLPYTELTMSRLENNYDIEAD